jgi:hypothetical protein
LKKHYRYQDKDKSKKRVFIHNCRAFPFTSGTGSNPPGDNGEHFNSLLPIRTHARKKGIVAIVSLAYSLHDG